MRPAALTHAGREQVRQLARAPHARADAPHAGLQRARARLHLVNLLCVYTCRVPCKTPALLLDLCHARRNDDCKRFLRGLRAPLNAEYARHARAASRACARHIQLSSDDDNNNATLVGVLPSTYKRSSAARRLRMWSTTRRYAYRALHHRASILSTQLGLHSWASKSGLGRLLTDDAGMSPFFTLDS